MHDDKDSHPRTPFQILGAHSGFILPILCCLVILFLLYNPFLGHDIWWHILIGRSIVFDHVWPNKDTFTYTIPGKEFVIHSWLAECLFALLYRAGGEIALYAFRIGILLLYALLLARFLKRVTGSVPVTALLTTLGVYLVHDSYVRPYLFPPLLTVFLFEAARDTRPFRRMAKEFLCVVLWANLHPSFPFGLALAVYLEWYASRDGAWYTTPLLFCLLLLSAGFLQPQGWSGLFYPFRAMQFPTGDWKPWLEQVAEAEIPPGIFFCYFLVSLGTVLSLFIRIRSRAGFMEILHICVGIVILFLSLIARRFSWFLLVTALICAPALPSWNAAFPNFLSRFKEGKSITAVLNWIAVFSIILLGCMKIEHRTDLYRDPVEAIAFMRETKMEGNAFVYLPWAGRILHDLDGKLRVFMDTRIEPFVPMVYDGHLAVLLESDLTPTILNETDILLMPNSMFRPSRLRVGKDWIRVWASVNETIYLKNSDQGKAMFGRISEYYSARNVPFNNKTGLSVLDALRANWDWTVGQLFGGYEGTAAEIKPLLDKTAEKLDQNADENPKETAEAYLQLGRQFMKSRLGSEAAHCFFESLKRESSSLQTELAFAESLFAVGQDSYALDCLKRVLQHNPQAVPALQMWLSYAAQSTAQKEKREDLDAELRENLSQVIDKQGLTSGGEQEILR